MSKHASHIATYVDEDLESTTVETCVSAFPCAGQQCSIVVKTTDGTSAYLKALSSHDLKL